MMIARNEHPGAPIRLLDYRPPAWRVEQVALDFDLDIDHTELSARLQLRCDALPPVPLRLHGEDLELLAITLDGQPVAQSAWHYADGLLEVTGARDGSVLETRVRLRPAQNTALEGLYLSGSRAAGFLLTQCEAEGFRRITFFPDRPDVQARYTVTLRADRTRFPVLLAGGNRDGSGELEDGRHWARFVDPYPKPSYLFALVAGPLQSISRVYHSADGRQIQLKIWAEVDMMKRCHYALDALERAMRWDERVYGRYYDLEVFHIVATHDFNMGAMENKGLNIFNAKALLVDPDTSTDEEYRNVEAVVAHEYFHNWSGNRVTCRDWFQLSLKEGFTVFREQSFSADENSPALKRIEDVAMLRRTQFPEDAGPLAHPVRPAQYSKIDNFYTATVYEKGAELVRMLAGRLGPAGFRRGTDLYFSRHDGQAATIEDFLATLGEANGVDLSAYLAWYAQAGTPRLSASGTYHAAQQCYRLTLRQHTPATPGQRDKAALPIPVRLALFAADGHMLPLYGEGATGENETVMVLEQAEHTFVFERLPTRPLPSLLRDFSAPVVLEYAYTPAELALLLRHDSNDFNRWEAGQQLATHAYEALRDGVDEAPVAAWCEALALVFNDDKTAIDHALLAELLTPPSEIELAHRQASIDPAQIHTLREALQQKLAIHLGAAVLSARYLALAASTNAALDAASQAARHLKRRVLQLLAWVDRSQAIALAAAQYDTAQNMTDRLAALTLWVQQDTAQAEAALAHFYQRYHDDALTLDKWFALQAQLPGPAALARVQTLEADPAFTLKNPNRVRALLGAFAQHNPTGFHRPDGAAYAFLSERLIQLDALNPQVAARLATAFNGWQRLEPQRRQAAHATLAALASRQGLSGNITEILQRILQT